MTAIIHIAVRHVLDSLGNRTMEVDDRLGDGAFARAAVAVAIA